MVRIFPKSANQPNEMALTICNLIFRNCFRLMRDWKLESLANGKEISAVPFRTEKEEYLKVLHGTPQFPNGIGPIAATSSRDVIFIKLWATALRMPEMENAYRKYHNGQVRGPWP